MYHMRSDLKRIPLVSPILVGKKKIIQGRKSGTTYLYGENLAAVASMSCSLIYLNVARGLALVFTLTDENKEGGYVLPLPTFILKFAYVSASVDGHTASVKPYISFILLPHTS